MSRAGRRFKRAQQKKRLVDGFQATASQDAPSPVTRLGSTGPLRQIIAGTTDALVAASTYLGSPLLRLAERLRRQDEGEPIIRGDGDPDSKAGELKT